MSSELGDLYQELILDHNRRPHNFGALKAATHSADGYNPLCGDRFTIYVRLDAQGTLAEVAFAGQGCAISKASASMMTDRLKGRSMDQAQDLFGHFHNLLTGEAEVDEEALGKLAAFAGVRAFPMRVKCATLAWHAMRAALAGAAKSVSTESRDTSYE